MVDPFHISRRKIARAKLHLANLEIEVGAFFAGRPYTPFRETDPNNPKYEIHKLRFDKPIPDGVSNLLEEAIHHLRSALDSACYSVALLAGLSDKSKPNASFPFARSAGEFENGMKGRCSDMPLPFHALFRALQPHVGGNDALWAINEIANSDKHAILGIGSGAALDGVEGVGGVVCIPTMPIWNSRNQELEIGTFVTGDLQYKMDFSFFVAFEDVRIVTGQPILHFLRFAVESVEYIVNAIETESRRLWLIK